MLPPIIAQPFQKKLVVRNLGVVGVHGVGLDGCLEHEVVVKVEVERRIRRTKCVVRVYVYKVCMHGGLLEVTHEVCMKSRIIQKCGGNYPRFLGLDNLKSCVWHAGTRMDTGL